ncbi:hypothetical protein OZX74_07475 [Bifidobacterium sp. ESL0798]|uniref:hypothetical protein n=1 Tax=Bifidobacterium sp. ESL0798 TaxID=2983235 RepID=UPI0023F63F0B|nr:hypothetical protein [Bifidobacterium sp. ESL0798]WEV73730.1 hypothetical protein OZX74_07475 [Bifidobacterium sp. ESL0798]
MDCYALAAALLLVGAVLCLGWPNETGKHEALAPTAATSQDMHKAGILSCIDALRALVKAGGSLEEAFGEQMQGEPLSETATMPDLAQLQDILYAQLGKKETVDQANQAAIELDLACKLSKTLGCEASHCLDAVASSYKRNRMMKTLKDNAFTVPKSTVKLLSLLPLAGHPRFGAADGCLASGLSLRQWRRSGLLIAGGRYLWIGNAVDESVDGWCGCG